MLLVPLVYYLLIQFLGVLHLLLIHLYHIQLDLVHVHHLKLFYKQLLQILVDLLLLCQHLFLLIHHHRL
jgi:hypothetical protein